MSTLKIKEANEMAPVAAYISSQQHNASSFVISSLSNEKEEALYCRLENKFSYKQMYVKLKLKARDMVEGEVWLSREILDYIGLVEGDDVLCEPIPEGFHEVWWAGKVTFTAYRAKFEESACASDIEAHGLVLGSWLENALSKYCKHQVMHKGQKLSFNYNAEDLVFLVTDVTGSSHFLQRSYGGINDDTKIVVTKYSQAETFRPGVDPDDLKTELSKRGIGGMERVMDKLVKAIFKPNCIPKAMKLKLDFSAISGVLFYGPPGTGKTLIAQNLCTLILCVKPKIVNGPELFAYEYGRSEQNVRKLFDDARNDYEKYGSNSPLHVIIFDEFESIAKKRGMESSTGDRVVNQLLTMLGGISRLPNLLAFCTTNRMELIDEAILRSGRIELHIRVSNPRMEERLDILNMLFKRYKRCVIIDEDVDVAEIAKLTKGRTGADLVSLMSRAFGLSVAQITFQELKNLDDDSNLLVVQMEHFREALKEMFDRPDLENPADLDD